MADALYALCLIDAVFGGSGRHEVELVWYR